MLRAARYCITALASVLLSTAFADGLARATTPQDRRVVVLYSTEDSLCKPLAELYQWIIFGQSKVGFYAEDTFASRFQSIGLLAPKPLDDYLHELSPDPIKQAYYRLKFAGEASPRLAYLEDRATDSHGDIKTNVWILKPGADVDGKKRFIDGYNFTPESVGLAILLSVDSDFVSYWGTDNPNFRTVRGPFFFKKIAHQDDLALPAVQLPPKVPNVGAGVAYAIQRVFLFHGEPIFLADDQLAFLAYRFEADSTRDVCYLARADYLRTLDRDYLKNSDRPGRT